jgi:hypothetical protein
MKKNKTNNKIIIYSAASITLNGFIAFQIIPENLIPIIRSSEIISIVQEPASRDVTKNNFKPRHTFRNHFYYYCSFLTSSLF